MVKQHRNKIPNIYSQSNSTEAEQKCATMEANYEESSDYESAECVTAVE